MKKCILCRHAVSTGNRHRAGHCPPVAGKTGEHHRRKMIAKRRGRRESNLIPQRGQAIAGTGVPKGASKG